MTVGLRPPLSGISPPKFATLVLKWAIHGSRDRGSQREPEGKSSGLTTLRRSLAGVCFKRAAEHHRGRHSAEIQALFCFRKRAASADQPARASKLVPRPQEVLIARELRQERASIWAPRGGVCAVDRPGHVVKV
eukprot:evm.model.scf_65.10 EVM.evm.TU.scf_65.10   scf_65:84186-84617(-)